MTTESLPLILTFWNVGAGGAVRPLDVPGAAAAGFAAGEAPAAAAAGDEAAAGAAGADVGFGASVGLAAGAGAWLLQAARTGSAATPRPSRSIARRESRWLAEPPAGTRDRVGSMRFFLALRRILGATDPSFSR